MEAGSQGREEGSGGDIEEKEMLLLCLPRGRKKESKAEQRERELQRDKDEFYLHEKGPHY